VIDCLLPYQVELFSEFFELHPPIMSETPVYLRAPCPRGAQVVARYFKLWPSFKVFAFLRIFHHN